MELELRQEFAGEPDLRHQVRRLRWFKRSFRRDADLIARHHGIELAIDDRRLTEAFLNWIEAFNRQKAYASSIGAISLFSPRASFCANSSGRAR